MTARQGTEGLLPPWARELGEQGDVVISSRVRLARNLKERRFPAHADAGQMAAVLAEVERAVTAAGRPLKLIKLEELSPLERLVLVEKHLISPQFADEPRHKAVLLRDDGVVSVMVNEEDHLRLQSILPGLDLAKAWDLVNQLDDVFEASLDYAFDPNIGYLTACPTNVGTGMRASLMLHLPGLIMVDGARKALSALAHFGFNVRGLYGEGSESHGGIFQISNQVTMGQSEEGTINKLLMACRKVIDHERTARQGLMSESRLQLEDRIWRSYGILSQVRILSSEEALRLLSDFKLGLDLGLIQGIVPNVAKELFLLTRAGLLQQLAGRELSPGERDYYRAAMVRERLRGGRAG